jgi:hypothetical protein
LHANFFERGSVSRGIVSLATELSLRFFVRLNFSLEERFAAFRNSEDTRICNF